jgi:hypothetical protein
MCVATGGDEDVSCVVEETNLGCGWWVDYIGFRRGGIKDKAHQLKSNQIRDLGVRNVV